MYDCKYFTLKIYALTLINTIRPQQSKDIPDIAFYRVMEMYGCVHNWVY